MKESRDGRGFEVKVMGASSSSEANVKERAANTKGKKLKKCRLVLYKLSDCFWGVCVSPGPRLID